MLASSRRSGTGRHAKGGVVAGMGWRYPDWAAGFPILGPEVLGDHGLPRAISGR